MVLQKLLLSIARFLFQGIDCNSCTLSQSILGGEMAEWTQPKNWADERKEGRKEYSEGLSRFFVIV